MYDNISATIKKRNISIIVDFGCQNNCWYCIWKTHAFNLKNKHVPNMDKVSRFILESGKNKVSISGGGDPLYNYKIYKNTFWDKLFDICTNVKVDIHTRVRLTDDSFFKKINKVVLSSDNPDDDIEYIKYLSNLTKVRISHVVTKFTTDEFIQKYLEIQNIFHVQLTLKKIVNYDDDGNYEKFKKQYSDIYCLDDNDYNLYYMPNDTITEKFQL